MSCMFQIPETFIIICKALSTVWIHQVIDRPLKLNGALRYIESNYSLKVLVAEAQAHEDKLRQLNDTVEKLKQICDPQQVKEKAASVTELHKGMSILFSKS